MSEEKTVKVSPEVGAKISDLLAQKGEKAFLEQADLALENQRLKEELQKQAQEDPNSGKGSLPASLNQGEGGTGYAESKGMKEFSSYEEMLEGARVNNKPAYEAIKAKTVEGLKENKMFWEWKDEFDKDGRSIIGRTLERMNQAERRKNGYKEE